MRRNIARLPRAGYEIFSRAPTGGRAFPAALIALAAAAWPSLVAATPPSPAVAAAAAPTGAAVAEAALAALPDADLVVIGPTRDGQLPSALVATRVAAPPAALAALLLDPRAYRQAIPALIRAEVIDHRRRPGAPADDRLVSWELEIPLFNLEGKLWICPREGGVELALVEGDLAPGRLWFTWKPAAGDGPGGATILTLEAQANVRAAGWLFRRIVSRSPFGAAAMNATAAWVVVRAAAALAEHPSDPRARRPQAPPDPPAPMALDRRALAGPPFEVLRARGAVVARR
jgi:hypothetical protein